MVEQALQHGARGYIPKSSPAKLMLNALQLVIAGGTYIPPQILLNKIIEPGERSTNGGNPRHALTPRQNEVLHELAKGKSNKAIGNTLVLTESTVRAHVAAILKAFNASNRTQAVQYATQNDLLGAVLPKEI
jgi:DNA-binding NarL/FixJ family response regulator